MADMDSVIKEVRAALEREPRVNPHHNSMEISFSEGVLTLSGEIESIAAKKLAMERSAVPGVTGIVDRLRIVPAEPMEDGAIRDHVCHALIEEPVFSEYAVKAMVKDAWEIHRDVPRGAAGEIEVEVSGGVVTLNGRGGSLSHKRLAGVLAWWVPGSRDVVNGLAVVPEMEDNDYELTDAVRLVLEKDPFVNASQIRVTCRNFVVKLEGVVPRPKEREMAEADAWYVFRVDDVINELEIRE